MLSCSITTIQEKRLLLTIKEINAIGVPVYPVQADLTKIDEIDSLFSYLDSLDHQLRILVNSAAVMQRGDIQTLSVEELGYNDGA